MFGVFAFFSAVAAVVILRTSISSGYGWMLIMGAVAFAMQAVRYRSSGNITYAVSGSRVLGILAVCVIPPLLLILAFGDRPGWFGPLISLLLVSVSLGPVLLLHRYARKPGPPGDAPKPSNP